MAHYVNRLPGWTLTLFVVLAVVLVAAVTRFTDLSTAPPGFLLAEAEAALHARSLDLDHLPFYPHAGELDSHGPVFGSVMNVTGNLLGWDVAGARGAAALLGIVTAAACALWYRWALGAVWGIAGGLLVATAFWQLMFSRQAVPAITAAALAALGLACLWQAIQPTAEAGSDGADRSSWGWPAAAGLAFGMGVYAHPSFLPVIVVAPAIAMFLSRRRTARTPEIVRRQRIGVMLVCLLALVVPLVVHAVSDPEGLRGWLAQDWDNDGAREEIRSLPEGLLGYVSSAASIVWDGDEAWSMNLPGRPLLDPLLALWAVAGLGIALRRPSQPLHGVALIWTTGFLLPAAMLDPGNPRLLLPLTPVVFLFPLLAMRTAVAITPPRDFVRRLVALVIAFSIIGSAAWSAYDYFYRWSRAEETYLAFNGDVRDALEAVERLQDHNAPVYYASVPSLAPLADYLAPDLGRMQARSLAGGGFGGTIDSRNTLIVPRSGGGYLVYPASAQLPAALAALLGEEPAEIGRTPDGDAAYRVWRVGQSLRERLPYTIPTIRFPHGFALVGFSIAPDYGDLSATGRLPDEPRVSVTLVWRVPQGATAHIAHVRLVPEDPGAGGAVTSAEAVLPAGVPVEAGARSPELVIVRLSVPAPETEDMIVDVQAGLSTTDGKMLAPVTPPAVIDGDYATLNRVQYLPAASTP